MTASANRWIKLTAIWLVLAALFLLAMRFIALLLGIALGLSVLLVEIAGYILLIVGMPFLLWVVGQPAYRIFIKPYIRAWRIRRIREARYLKEAVDRGRSSNVS